MIIRGLEEIEAYLDGTAVLANDKVSYEGWKADIEAGVNRCGVEGADHFHLTSVVDEDEDQRWLWIHIDANSKFVEVAGEDCSPYKAFRDIHGYCEFYGLDYAEMMRSHEDFVNRHNAAWREQFPEEAAEYDQRQADYTARANTDQW